MAALTGGGHSRLALDKATLTNRYFCPQQADDKLTCFSSCTASPISAAGFADALACHGQVMESRGGSPSPERMDFWLSGIKKRLGDLAGGGAVADIILLPSGTDGMLFRDA